MGWSGGYDGRRGGGNVCLGGDVVVKSVGSIGAGLAWVRYG